MKLPWSRDTDESTFIKVDDNTQNDADNQTEEEQAEEDETLPEGSVTLSLEVIERVVTFDGSGNPRWFILFTDDDYNDVLTENRYVYANVEEGNTYDITFNGDGFVIAIDGDKPNPRQYQT
jgi:hypothetical protein